MDFDDMLIDLFPIGADILDRSCSNRPRNTDEIFESCIALCERPFHKRISSLTATYLECHGMSVLMKNLFSEKFVFDNKPIKNVGSKKHI